MKKSYTSMLSLAGMFLVIGLAYGLDVWMDNLKRIAQTEFRLLSFWLLPATIMELLFAGLTLIWLWFVYYKDGDHRVVALIYVLFGLGLLFYNYAAIASNLPLPMLLAITPKSLSAFACSLVAMVGLQRLIFRKTKL